MADNKKSNVPDTYLNGKIPPQSIQMEENILGALMIDREAFNKIRKILKPEHFYLENHIIIFEAICSLEKKTFPIDISTVTHEVTKAGKFDVIGGSMYITQLTNKVISPDRIEYYAIILLEKYLLREIGKIGAITLRDSYVDNSDPFDLIEKAEKAIAELKHNITTKKKSKDLKVAANETVDDANQRRTNKVRPGVRTHISEIDYRTGGMQKGDLILIGARPSMGKSSMIVTILCNASLESGKKIGFFSLEMNEKSILNRIASQELLLNLNKIHTESLDDGEFARYEKLLLEIQGNRIFIDDEVIDIDELEFRAEEMVLKHGVEMIMVDYLQLIKYKEKYKETKNDAVGAISKRLKALAKKLDVPVIALSQLSRLQKKTFGQKTTLNDFKPGLEDLRDSGELEQSADVVFFLLRPWYYKDQLKLEVYQEFHIHIICAKFRNGATFEIILDWQPDFARIVDSKSTPEKVIEFNNRFNDGKQDEPKSETPF